ncbi:hypothetical protein ACP26L_36580 (plasmid) [Paenibacillus sp. S-38]|uniref:hypothetical protein n=1 Tax=Paenibacillus sp. S-38 TaxID=3416710 RepID=UPI003CFB9E14
MSKALKTTPALQPVAFTTLFKNTEGKYGVMHGDKFTTEGTFYVQGHRAWESPLNLMLRICATLLMEKLNTLLECPKNRNFVNGGTYSSGAMVQEAIIYTPYTKHAWGERTKAEVSEKQSIFTFYLDALDQEPFDSWSLPTTQIYSTKRWVKGIRISENGSTKHFERVLGNIPVYKENNHGDWYERLFPGTQQEEMYVTSTRVDDLVLFVEATALLIQKYYFNGRSYAEKRELEEMNCLAHNVLREGN